MRLLSQFDNKKSGLNQLLRASPQAPESDEFTFITEGVF